ncbi:hypothetical protein [Stenotrophomonas phage CM2]
MFPAEPDGVVFSMDDIAQLIAAVKKNAGSSFAPCSNSPLRPHAGDGHIGPEDDRSDLGRGPAHGRVDLAQVSQELHRDGLHAFLLSRMTFALQTLINILDETFQGG